MAFREPSIEELADNVNNPNFGDDRLGIIFYEDVAEDAEQSLAQGRKVFRSIEMVKIMIPGERFPTIRKVQKTGNRGSDDSLRWPKQYRAFKEKLEQTVHSGTPLALWPRMRATLAEEMKYINIYTVEQLAELSDAHCQKVPKGYEWKQQARDFVNAMKDSGVVTRLQADLAERDNRISTLEEVVKDQGRRIEELAAKKGR